MYCLYLSFLFSCPTVLLMCNLALCNITSLQKMGKVITSRVLRATLLVTTLRYKAVIEASEVTAIYYCDPPLPDPDSGMTFSSVMKPSKSLFLKTRPILSLKLILLYFRVSYLNSR
jgi:hypothetical protein